MRKPFNTTCSIYTGPNGFPPSTFVGSFPCRLVFQDGINTTLIAGAEPSLPYWITIEGRCPRGMFVTPGMQLDVDAADRIAVPQLSAVRFAVLYTDLIIWKDQRPYWRAYLMQLPLPTPEVGGVVIGGIAAIAPPGGVILGGVQCGGAGHIIPGRIAGGILAGGFAIVVPGSVYHPHGGILAGGQAKIAPPDPKPIVGGAVVGGIATVSFTPGIGHVLDTYTAADGTNPTSRPCDTGQVPISSSSAYVIESNACTNPTNTSYLAPLVYQAGAADVKVNADLEATHLSGPSGTNYFGSNLVFRWVSDNQFFLVQPYNGFVSLYVNNFGFTQIGTGAATLVDGVVYNIRAELAGSSISIFLDNVLLYSITNTNFLGATRHGIIIKGDITGNTSYVPRFEVVV